MDTTYTCTKCKGIGFYLDFHFTNPDETAVCNTCVENMESKENWVTELQKAEINFPMSITNWSQEDWINHIRKLLTHQKQSIMDMCDEMMKREPRVYSLPYNEALSDLKERINKM